MRNFVKNLSDGGLAEDTYAFMERVLDEQPKSEMVNKQEFIEKVCKIYRKHLIKFNPTLKDFPTALDEGVNMFRKQLEE